MFDTVRQHGAKAVYKKYRIYEIFQFQFLIRSVPLIVEHLAFLGLDEEGLLVRLNQIFSRQLPRKLFLWWIESRLTQAPVSQLLSVFLSSGFTFGSLPSSTILWVSWILSEAQGTVAFSLGKLGFFGLDFACLWVH